MYLVREITEYMCHRIRFIYKNRKIHFTTDSRLNVIHLPKSYEIPTATEVSVILSCHCENN